jgi:heparan-alpha-glucosaminide N-acetyltransferase
VYYLLGFAFLLLLFGFLSRPQWGISKIRATPSWTAICAAITTLSFGLMHLVADRWKFIRWADIIEAAGSSTLTCYLVPYYVYALAAMTGLSMPDALTTGIPGLLKSLVFSLLIIQLTGLLGKVGIRLKI